MKTYKQRKKEEQSNKIMDYLFLIVKFLWVQYLIVSISTINQNHFIVTYSHQLLLWIIWITWNFLWIFVFSFTTCVSATVSNVLINNYMIIILTLYFTWVMCWFLLLFLFLGYLLWLLQGQPSSSHS